MARRVPHQSPMGTRNASAEEVEMTEIEERIEDQRDQARLLQKQLDCECPDTSCPVEHES